MIEPAPRTVEHRSMTTTTDEMLGSLLAESGHPPPHAPDHAEPPELEPTELARPKPENQRWVLPLGVAVIGSFLAYLDISVVNVGIAEMQNQFGAALPTSNGSSPPTH